MKFRKVLTFFAISILIVLGQIVIARLVPIVAAIFYIPSIIFLSILKDSAGLQTYQGSPEGLPVPTDLGEQILVISWWLFWVMLLSINYGIKRYREGA